MKQRGRWIKAMAVFGALLGGTAGAAGAWAWAGADLPLHAVAWETLMPRIPASHRVWLLLPAGVLAMVFTARRSAARGSSF